MASYSHPHQQQQQQQDYATHNRLKVLTSDDARMALFLVECRQLQPVTRRPDDYEKTRITHGSVFVWLDGVKGETGLERWTDGRSWGPSKCRDDFLLYEEKSKNGERRLTKATYTARRNTLEGSGLLWHLIAYYYKDETDTLVDMRTDEVFAPYANNMAPGYFVSNRKDKSRRPREIPAQVPVSPLSRYDELIAALKNVLPSSSSTSSSTSTSTTGSSTNTAADDSNNRQSQPRAGRPPSSSSVYTYGPPPGLPGLSEKEKSSNSGSSTAHDESSDVEMRDERRYRVAPWSGRREDERRVGVERHARLSSSARPAGTQYQFDLQYNRPSSPYFAAHRNAHLHGVVDEASRRRRGRADTESTSSSSSASSSGASSYAASSRSSESPSPSMSDCKIPTNALENNRSGGPTSAAPLSIVPLDRLHAAARRRGAAARKSSGTVRRCGRGEEEAYEEAMRGVVAMDVSADHHGEEGGEKMHRSTLVSRETFRQMDERQLSLLNRSLWRFS